MFLGRVIGSVYGTIRHPFYEGRSLLMVARIRPDGEATGDYLIAVDAIGAGPGDPVLVLDEGTGARQVLASDKGPVRSVIVGFVDAMRLDAPTQDHRT